MAILGFWLGEDIEFPNGTAPIAQTTAGYFSSSRVRCGVNPYQSSGQLIKSTVLPGGEVTTCWFSFRGRTSSLRVGRIYGLGKSGTTKGLYIGGATGVSSRAALIAYDGSSETQLAAEVGNSMSGANLQRFDLHLTNYGAHSAVQLYIDGALVIDEPDISTSISGVTGFDSVFVYCGQASSYTISEAIIADEDCRAFLCQGYYPNNPGSLLEWTGAYSTVDEIANSDADYATVNLSNKKAQYALSDTVAGSYSVHAAKNVARALKTSDSTPTKLCQGVLSGGVTDVDAGQTPTPAWTTYERYYTQINGAAITTAILDAAEIDLESAA